MIFLKQWFNDQQLSLFEDKYPPKQEDTPSSSNKIRTIELSNQKIPYVLKRVRRKTVGITIDEHGLQVRANSTVSIIEIERILYNKAHWILKHLHKQKQRLIQPQTSFVPNMNLPNGGVIHLLGRSVTICWETTTKFDALSFWQESHTNLVLNPVPNAKKTQVILDAICDVLLVFLNERAQTYASHFSLHYRTILLSNAKTLWGTCRADGTIRLNWRLAFLDTSLVEYVLIHELAHTVHMNHSAKFWAQVALMCPLYKQHIKALKTYNLRTA